MMEKHAWNYLILQLIKSLHCRHCFFFLRDHNQFCLFQYGYKIVLSFLKGGVSLIWKVHIGQPMIALNRIWHTLLFERQCSFNCKYSQYRCFSVSSNTWSSFINHIDLSAMSKIQIDYTHEPLFTPMFRHADRVGQVTACTENWPLISCHKKKSFYLATRKHGVDMADECLFIVWQNKYRKIQMLYPCIISWKY